MFSKFLVVVCWISATVCRPKSFSFLMSVAETPLFASKSICRHTRRSKSHSSRVSSGKTSGRAAWRSGRRCSRRGSCAAPPASRGTGGGIPSATRPAAPHGSAVLAAPAQMRSFWRGRGGGGPRTSSSARAAAGRSAPSLLDSCLCRAPLLCVVLDGALLLCGVLDAALRCSAALLDGAPLLCGVLDAALLAAALLAAMLIASIGRVRKSNLAERKNSRMSQRGQKNLLSDGY